MKASADVLRGGFIALMFAVVLFVLIPEHVPRPAFIPGFAPPPDMWPKLISVCGMCLGLLEVMIALLQRRAIHEAKPSLSTWLQKHKDHLWRFFLACVVLTMFIVLIPLLGFLIASILVGVVIFLLAGGWQYRLTMLALAFFTPLALYFIFKYFINTPFPQGSLFKALGGG
jgi:putative tricarboxylic transport membrane protein